MISRCIIVIRLSYFPPLQLHAKLLDTERQLGELQGRLKEQRQLSGEKLKDREQQVADLQLKLSRVDEQVKTENGWLLEFFQDSTYKLEGLRHMNAVMHTKSNYSFNQLLNL